MPQIKKYLSEELYYSISEKLVGLVMNKNATKWNGVLKLLEYYNISKQIGGHYL
jgi:hypothetical protein